GSKSSHTKPAGFTLHALPTLLSTNRIIAAIAIPSLLRARVSANESAAIGDIRTVISSQAAYHSASGGRYGRAICLLDPTAAGCIPNYPSNGPTFLDSAMSALLPKAGHALFL